MYNWSGATRVFSLCTFFLAADNGLLTLFFGFEFTLLVSLLCKELFVLPINSRVLWQPISTSGPLMRLDVGGIL